MSLDPHDDDRTGDAGNLALANPKRGVVAPARRDPWTGFLLLEVAIASARMHVPSMVRDFGEPLMLVPRSPGRIDIMSERKHRWLLQRLATTPQSPANAQEHALVLGEFEAMFCDADGFMNLTIGLLAWARITAVGLLVVQRDSAQLWEPGRYRAGRVHR